MGGPQQVAVQAEVSSQLGDLYAQMEDHASAAKMYGNAAAVYKECSMFFFALTERKY